MVMAARKIIDSLEISYQIHFEIKGRDGHYNSGTYDIMVKPKPTNRMEENQMFSSFKIHLIQNKLKKHPLI